MIKLNGKKYFCCDEIVNTAIAEISKVFDQYTNHSTPYPPVSGILQLSDEHRNQICLVQSKLKNKIKNYYCSSNENCCNSDTILKYLQQFKHCELNILNYNQYIKNINSSEDPNDRKKQFCNFLENVCIDLITTKIKDM